MDALEIQNLRVTILERQESLTKRIKTALGYKSDEYHNYPLTKLNLYYCKLLNLEGDIAVEVFELNRIRIAAIHYRSHLDAPRVVIESIIKLVQSLQFEIRDLVDSLNQLRSQIKGRRIYLEKALDVFGNFLNRSD